MTIWYIFYSFGTFFPSLVSCTKKNLATLEKRSSCALPVLYIPRTTKTADFVCSVTRVRFSSRATKSNSFFRAVDTKNQFSCRATKFGSHDIQVARQHFGRATFIRKVSYLVVQLTRKISCLVVRPISGRTTYRPKMVVRQHFGRATFMRKVPYLVVELKIIFRGNRTSAELVQSILVEQQLAELL
jgi:hypothetical protein